MSSMNHGNSESPTGYAYHLPRCVKWETGHQSTRADSSDNLWLSLSLLFFSHFDARMFSGDLGTVRVW